MSIASKKLQIVLVTYNRSAMLRRTLRYLFAKNSPVKDCDITILNNCSTDDTLAVIGEETANRDNVSVVTHYRNIGGNANIVRAFELARKEYIWVLCDDDGLDWGDWKEIDDAIADGSYGMIFTVNKLTKQSRRMDIGYYAYLAGFLPGCIYKTTLINGDVLQNMYFAIHTFYPHAILYLNAMCNCHCNIFLPSQNIVTRNMEETIGAAIKSLVRGIDDRLVHPDVGRMFWHVGFVKAAQIIKDKKLRWKVIERTRFDENWSDYFINYCKTIIYHNRQKSDGAKNSADFLLNVNFLQGLLYVLAVPYRFSPISFRGAEDGVYLRLLWKFSFRIKSY